MVAPRNFNAALSDEYTIENIYAAYLQLDRDWEKWAMAIGLRAEQTDVEGDSRSLGQVNTQNYFELFLISRITNQVNDNNSVTLSYRRSIERPRIRELESIYLFYQDNTVNTGNNFTAVILPTDWISTGPSKPIFL
jgi:outer membrane receptor protein involved in Fe transport